MGSLGGKGLECKLTLADCILAILSAGAPDLVPFMADEAIMAIPDMGEINYNLQFYMKFLEKVSKVEEQLKKKGIYYIFITLPITLTYQKKPSIFFFP